jgi:hypothetical protein
VDTRADSWDVSGCRLGGDNSGLRGDGSRLAGDHGDSCGLGGLRSSNGEHSRDNAERVGLGEERSLGESIDRGLECLLVVGPNLR